MNRNDYYEMQSKLINSQLSGRKLTRIMIANANLIGKTLLEQEKALQVYFGQEKYAKASMVNGELIKYADQSGRVTKENVEKVKEQFPEEFVILQEYNAVRAKWLSEQISIDLIPIPERLLPKSVTTFQRYEIESLIKF